MGTDGKRRPAASPPAETRRHIIARGNAPWVLGMYYGFRVPRMRREMPSSGFCCPFTGIAERRRAAYLYGGDDGELGVELGETVQQSRCRGRLASVQDSEHDHDPLTHPGSGEVAEKECKPPRFVYDALGGSVLASWWPSAGYRGAKCESWAGGPHGLVTVLCDVPDRSRSAGG